tara:strand:- start:5773 stop:7089 length:1317 start_codon:yes stop_codon:yes gene_type:complete
MRILSYTFLLLFIVGSLQADDNIIYIQNSKIKLGVNLELGGAITYLSKSESDENMINNYDWGRQIQMSFYSGPNPYIPESGQQPHEAWAFLGWNPIQSGDVGGFKSQVVDYFHGDDSIYVKSIPMQWPLENVPGECFFESSIKIKDNLVHVDNRIINNRKDKTQYPARSQELPAVYVNAPYHRLVSYKGDKPFENDTISEIPQNSETEPLWSYWQATENWVAHLNENDFGLGVITPEVQSYIGGFFGKKGVGGTKDAPTGYCAPILKEILDHNIVYEYSFNLCVGSLEQIRSFATKKRNNQTGLEYTFKKDRNHFYYTNAIDNGWPIDNMLEIKPEGNIIYINSPDIYYKTDSNFTFSIDALFPDNIQQVTLICESLDKKDEMVYKLAIQPDNLFHNYQINLKTRNKKDFIIGRIKIKVELDRPDEGTLLKIKEFGLM